MFFGDYIKELRLSKSLSLRKFCELCDIDPSNWSKIERNLLPLTLGQEALERMAATLGVAEGSEELDKFNDLATLAKKEIPEHVYKDAEILDILPVLFRAAGGERPTQWQRQKLIDLINNR